MLWAVWTIVQALRVFAQGVEHAAVPTVLPISPVRIDIDRATYPELLLLPGLGPGRAEAVVLERLRRGPYGSVDGLHRVPGIGPATLDALRPFVVPGDARRR